MVLYIPVYTNDAILSLMSSSTTLWISSKSPLDVVLLLKYLFSCKLMLLKIPMCEVHKWLVSGLLGLRNTRGVGLVQYGNIYNIWTGHPSYSTFLCPGLGYNQWWSCWIRPRALLGLVCGPQNGNAETFVVSQDIYKLLCIILALSWIWYVLSVHLYLLDSFLYFPLSIEPFLWDVLETWYLSTRFWYYYAILSNNNIFMCNHKK